MEINIIQPKKALTREHFFTIKNRGPALRKTRDFKWGKRKRLGDQGKRWKIPEAEARGD
jgi:hypothetical protein